MRHRSNEIHTGKGIAEEVGGQRFVPGLEGKILTAKWGDGESGYVGRYDEAGAGRGRAGQGRDKLIAKVCETVVPRHYDGRSGEILRLVGSHVVEGLVGRIEAVAIQRWCKEVVAACQD